MRKSTNEFYADQANRIVEPPMGFIEAGIDLLVIDLFPLTKQDPPSIRETRPRILNSIPSHDDHPRFFDYVLVFWAKTSATILGHKYGPVISEYFLAHASVTVSDQSYVPMHLERFFEALEYLRKEVLG